MGLPQLVVYTRHPQCFHNVNPQEAILQGIENRKSPLTYLGEMQRDSTAAYLRRKYGCFDRVFCSTYERTHTIPLAAGLTDVLVETHLLDERNMGVWHKWVRSKVLEIYPEEEIRHKEAGYYAYAPPEGESCVGVEERISRFLSSDMFQNAGEKVYISGHGIAGLCLRRVAAGGTVEDWHSWQRLKNASVSVFERKGEAYECVLYNHAPWEGIIDPSLLVKGVEA